jgi:hypothetical protein
MTEVPKREVPTMIVFGTSRVLRSAVAKQMVHPHTKKSYQVVLGVGRSALRIGRCLVKP